MAHQDRVFGLRIAVLFVGLLLMIVGITMIFMGVKAEGAMAVSMPFLEGTLTSTEAGLFLVLGGLGALGLSLFAKQSVSTEETRVAEEGASDWIAMLQSGKTEEALETLKKMQEVSRTEVIQSKKKDQGMLGR